MAIVFGKQVDWFDAFDFVFPFNIIFFFWFFFRYFPNRFSSNPDCCMEFFCWKYWSVANLNIFDILGTNYCRSSSCKWPKTSLKSSFFGTRRWKRWKQWRWWKSNLNILLISKSNYFILRANYFILRTNYFILDYFTTDKLLISKKNLN